MQPLQIIIKPGDLETIEEAPEEFSSNDFTLKKDSSKEFRAREKKNLIKSHTDELSTETRLQGSSKKTM